MNPLDTKLRRNRLSGFSARSGKNALANSRWGSKNPNGIPVPKLGIVWNSLINGLSLIEGIHEELTEDIFGKSLASSSPTAQKLIDLYEKSVNGRYEDWSSTISKRDLKRIAEEIGNNAVSKWLKSTDLRETNSEMRSWFLFEGGRSLEVILERILRDHG